MFLLKFQDTNYFLCLILSFTATPAVPKSLSEWQVGEVTTSVLLKATKDVCSLHSALNVACTYGSSITYFIE